MSVPSIRLGAQLFRYCLVRKPIRSIRLKLLDSSSFSISCPHFTPDSVLLDFIRQHSSWIIKNSTKIKPHPDISQLSSLSILGQPYSVITTQSSDDLFVFNSASQKIYVYAQSLSLTHLKHLFNLHLRPVARKLIIRELSLLRSQFNFNYHQVSVRNPKTRFGSCSAFGNLSFNWQIIFFPLPQFRHVLLHELTHLQHHNHSSAFWHQLALYDPDWKSHNLWLKKEGSSRLIF